MMRVRSLLFVRDLWRRPPMLLIGEARL